VRPQSGWEVADELASARFAAGVEEAGEEDGLRSGALDRVREFAVVVVRGIPGRGSGQGEAQPACRLLTVVGEAESVALAVVERERTPGTE
jgi:hypothetical protein